MKPATLKALKSSIEHWRRMSEGVGDDEPNVDQCALCGLFNNNKTEGGKQCEDCPVFNKTGVTLCSLTPYSTAANAFNDSGPDSPKFRAAAKLELLFLESLLPAKAEEAKA